MDSAARRSDARHRRSRISPRVHPIRQQSRGDASIGITPQTRSGEPQVTEDPRAPQLSRLTVRPTRKHQTHAEPLAVFRQEITHERLKRTAAPSARGEQQSKPDQRLERPKKARVP